MSGLDHGEARALKAELSGYVRELLERRVEASAARTRAGVALGLAPQPDGSFGVAVRYRLGVPTARMVARRVVEQVGDPVDVRRTGRISAIPGVVPRPPVITAQAAGETGRVRPLRPGVSIAHRDVTAGTLGAFVVVDGVVHVLSNYHVLVGSPAASVGDPILQPGPYDGGRLPQDKVGELAAFVPLAADGRFVVDGAVARLDDQEVDATYPVGAVTSTAVPAGAWLVEKIGRTTGVTRGRITAIELDDVVVGYGEGLGELAFDDQIEVEGIGSDPFSRGGDSGSLVYRVGGTDAADDGSGAPSDGTDAGAGSAPGDPDEASDGAEPGHPAVGLLFAGSESGGENGKGLTYLNPIDRVLESFGAAFVGS
ncbi:S1 family peptidase [Actinotalea sp. M2MS4P-6]|uniref:S1 family peptidase n=1 Tax=Actinotalea sp. M2MS4P-6 TaxID=2983762 RepID=UPI0021E4BB6C|nr:S1 family peptidase [Actinotalea sp. M2MS4P-6]MCV2392936.1 S1 family peptidase [Actinotalea sp. M2MS4P-6]